MSCYEWEAGTIKLPKTQYTKIYKQFVTSYNDIMLAELEAAKKLRDYTLEVNKGKRGVIWEYALQEHMDRFNISFTTVSRMFNGLKKPKTPTKKMIDFANNKTNGFSVDGEGSIIFNPEDKTVTYSIPENNHAVERARESAVGKLFFRTMRNVNWTRGSGGHLYGNDEYHRDNDYGNSGGGNYVTQTFGKPD